MIGEQIFAAIAIGAASGLASAPHCAAMCGPLTAAVCQRSQQRAAPLRYQLGRLLGYGLAGVVASRFGLALSSFLPRASSRWLFAGFTVVACLLFAVQLWPRAGRPGSAALIPLGRKGREAGDDDKKLSRFRVWRKGALSLLPRDATQVGALTALLPCGALAGALLLAAGAGSPLLGGVTMLAFASVSGLSLWLFGGASELLKRVQHTALRRGIALTLLGLAVFTVGASVQHSGATHHGRHASGDHTASDPAPAAAPPCH